MTEYLESPNEEARSDEDVLIGSLSSPSLFSLLVQKYEAPFLRKAMSIIKDEREAEDIVQETFVKIYLNASKFKKQEGAQFSSWGYRILVNTSLTHYMKRKRQTTGKIDLEPEILELLPDKSVEAFGKKEIADEVAVVLSKMSPIFAQVLTAFFIEGKPQEEIANQEQVSVGAIKTRVHRAKREFSELYKAMTKNI